MLTETNTYRVITDSLNIREGPSATSLRVGKLKKGDVIEMIGENDMGGWIKVMVGGKEGWISKKYLVNVPYVPPLGEDFAWMEFAEKEKGVKEFPGEENNPQVVEYLHATRNLDGLANSRDETPWCSAFVNWCVKRAGYKATEHAAARSWMEWGQKIETPRRGCIVVFQRNTNFGHVGFYLGETETEILVLGGNQQNKETLLFEVSEKYYPKANLLGYRIPG